MDKVFLLLFVHKKKNLACYYATLAPGCVVFSLNSAASLSHWVQWFEPELGND